MERWLKALIMLVLMVVSLFLVVWLISLSGCTSPEERYVRVRYSGCDVRFVRDNIYEVKCPGRLPFEQKVKRR